MVKANAYGHGLEELIEVFAEHADELGVATLDEGLRIRSRLTHQIPVYLVSGEKDWGNREYLDAVREAQLVPAVSSVEELRLLVDRVGGTSPFPVELKLDTGMGVWASRSVISGTWLPSSALPTTSGWWAS